MKLTAKQLSDIYHFHYRHALGECLEPNHYTPMWVKINDTLNAIIELETCHELALAQNVAVDTVIEWINDTNNVNVSRQAEYNGMFMKPAPPPLTRAELLRHMLDNEKEGNSINDGIAVIGNDKYWYPVTLEHSVNLHKPENYRIIK